MIGVEDLGPLALQSCFQGLIVSESDPTWITVQNLEQDNGARTWMMPHPALAIVAAGGMLAIFSLARTSGSRWHLSRRDVIWMVLIGSVALGCWLDDEYQSWQIRRLVPDASARWTITAANANLPP